MKKILLICFVTALILICGCQKGELSLTPTGKVVGNVNEAIGTEVGTGWSINENPEEAAAEAIGIALQGKLNKNPDLAIIFASSGSDLDKILAKTKDILGNDIKVYGGTSDSRAVMTEKGFVKATEKGYEYSKMEGKRGIAVMTISSKDITFGVGSSDFSLYASVHEASKAAVMNAILDAGKQTNELPDIILLTPTIGAEEEVVEGIEEVVGKETIILGGTTGGPTQAVFGKDRAYEKGVSLAVIYTDLPIGWTFEGGFDTRDPHTGIVTKVDGQNIVEIDNKPALDVYNEWLGGNVNQLHEEGKDPGLIRDLLTLSPIYRKYTSSTGQDYYLFSHPWPKDDNLIDRAVSTSTKINVGERIYLSKGTWETLVNRIGNLPKNAKLKGNINLNEKPILGIGVICAGVLGTIPESERKKIPLLINYANNDAPFIASFTWGEQGHFPGVGNKHGNLLTSFLVIGRSKEK